MNFLKPDSPVMRLISKIADILVLNILTIICSIPVITAGAAITANFSVAMKVVKDEDDGVFVPYFKAFIKNFKEATIAWLILGMAIFLIVIDWRWIIQSGWGTTPFVYRFLVIFMSAFVWLITLSIFPLIARYEMKIMEYFKAALILSITKFIPLALVSLFMLGAVVACIWYARWFPLLYAFCTLTSMYFLCLIYIKAFKRLEMKQKEEEEEDENKEEITEETEIVEEEAPKEEATPVPANASIMEEVSHAQAVKELHKEMENDTEREPEEEIKGNKLTKFIRTEKKKLKGLTFKQKIGYFVQYYLPIVILLLVFIVGVSWFAHDVYTNHKIIIKGGTINCQVSDAGHKYMTDDFVESLGYTTKQRTALLSKTNLDFQSDIDFEERYLDISLRAQMATGTFSYLIIRDDAMYNYTRDDYFTDLNSLIDIKTYFEEDEIYYGAEDVPVGLKLRIDTLRNLGLSEDHDYYIVFGYSTDDMKTQNDLIGYLFNLDAEA